MDILFYTSKPQDIQSYGMRTHVTELLANLHKLGHSIQFVDGELYSPDQPIGPVPGRKNGSSKSLLKWATGLASSSPLKSEAWLLWNFLKETRVFLYALRTVLRHRPEIIYWRESHFNSDCLISRLFGIPLVKEVNTLGGDELKISMRTDKATLWLYKIIQARTLDKADRIIVVTPEIKDLLQAEYRLNPDKVTVIQNGANTELFRPMDKTEAKERLGLDRNASYICFVGLMREWQGIEYLIKSLPLIKDRHPEARLLIVGDGPLSKELQVIAGEAGVLSSVIFTGAVPYREVPYYINASDVCAAPFITGLNKKGALCSLKMHEYMACGKPCVISRLDGIEDLVKNHCVVAVEPENITELAGGITSLLDSSELRKQFGENGRKYIAENQSWEKVSARVAEVLRDVNRQNKKILKEYA